LLNRNLLKPSPFLARRWLIDIIEFAEGIDNTARTPRYLIPPMNAVPTTPFDEALAIQIARINVIN
jgi:hypothetical protein